MPYRLILLSILVVSLLLPLTARPRHARPGGDDAYAEFIRDLHNQLPGHRASFVYPTENDLQEWSKIPWLLRFNHLDSCRAILHKYNYGVRQIFDPVSGENYSVVCENYPIRHNWGTYFYNHGSTKRLAIHVLRPVDELNTLQMGSEMFRRLGAEWLFVDGAQKVSLQESKGRFSPVKKTIFSRWHEILADLTRLTVSVRGFPASVRIRPDIVLSNGCTMDQQWGISQISMDFRDSLRTAGFDCILAMYDSGYANLAGGSSREGIFSNDSVGFGHWLNLELSVGLRTSSAQMRRFIGVVDHALEITGKKVSQEVNRAFGLVSPRVVRLDAQHRMLFPSADEGSYRIVSFNPKQNKHDTIDVQMGSWLDLVRAGGSEISTNIDTSGKLLDRARNQAAKGGTKSGIVVLAEPVLGDTSRNLENESADEEPIQTHRIPLQKVPVPEYVPEIASPQTAFTWNGILPAKGEPPIPFFAMVANKRERDDEQSVTEFLIPLLHRSAREESEPIIGVQMNSILVNEIARLVAQHRIEQHEIGLVAEQDPRGDYYLRLIPSYAPAKKLHDELARQF